MHRAAIGEDTALLDLRDVRALIDADTTALNDVGETAGQAGGMNPRGVGAEDGATCPRDRGALARLLGSEEPIVSIRVAEGMVRLNGMLRVLEAHLRHRERGPAALVVVGVDALFFERRADHVDRLETRALVAHDGIVPVVLHEPLATAGKAAVAPSAIAARCPVPGDIALDNDDAQRRVKLG